MRLEEPISADLRCPGRITCQKVGLLFSELNNTIVPIHRTARHHGKWMEIACFFSKKVLELIVPLENVHRHRFFHDRDDLFSLKPEGKLGKVSNAPNRELHVAFVGP
jgi:hypothetical protein